MGYPFKKKLDEKSCNAIERNKLGEFSSKMTLLYEQTKKSESKTNIYEIAYFHILHLTFSSDYKKINNVVCFLENFGEENGVKLTLRQEADLRYIKALNYYHQGEFKEALKVFFEEKDDNKSKGSFLGYNSEAHFFLGHAHLLLGKIYWKLGSNSQAFLSYLLAIKDFTKYNPSCIWLTKTFNLISLISIEFSKLSDSPQFLEDNLYLSGKILDANIKFLEYKLGKKNAIKNHFAACLHVDLAKLWIQKGESGQAKPLKAKRNLQRAKKIFHRLYNHEDIKNRYYASIVQSQGRLYKLRGRDSAASDTYFSKAKNKFKEDLKIRQTLYSLDDGMPHHLSIGRAHNDIAGISILQGDKAQNQEEKLILYDEALWCSQYALHAVVKYFSLEEEKGVNHSKIVNPDWNAEKIKGEKRLKIQSYSVVIKAVRNKIEALMRMKDRFAKEALKNTIDNSKDLISRLRLEMINIHEFSAYDWGNKLKPLNEVMLKYYTAELKKVKNESEKTKINNEIFHIIDDSNNFLLKKDKNENSFSNDFSEQNIFNEIYSGLSFSDGYCTIRDFEELLSVFKSVSEKHYKSIVQNLRDIRNNQEREKQYNKENSKVHLNEVRQKIKFFDEKFNNETAPKQSKTALLSFFYGYNNIYFQLITTNKVVSDKIDICPLELAIDIEDFSNFFEKNNIANGLLRRSSGAIEEYCFLAHEIYDALFDKIDITEDIGFLMLFPSGKLEHLPFDGLITETVPFPDLNSFIPEFLVEKYYTSYHFSISNLFNTLNFEATNIVSKKEEEYSLLYLGIGSEFSGAMAVQQQVLQEDVLETYNLLRDKINAPNRIKVYIHNLNNTNSKDDKEIKKLETESKDLEFEIKNMQVLDISTHGNGEGLFIELTPVFKLTKAHFESIEKAALVILRGCRTGRGPILKGEGGLSLGRLFIAHSQVRNVIHNLTSIIYDPKEIVELTEEIKNEIFEKSPKALNDEYKFLDLAGYNNCIYSLEHYFFENLLSNKKHGNRYAVSLVRAKREMIKVLQEHDIYNPKLFAGTVFYGNPLDYFNI